MRKSHRLGTHMALTPFSAPIPVLISLVLSSFIPAVEVRAQSAWAESLIGYSELSTNLPGGRHANVVTIRAVVSRADGTERRLVAEPLASEPNSSTQFAGWSPDGRLAIVGRGWKSLLMDLAHHLTDRGSPITRATRFMSLTPTGRTPTRFRLVSRSTSRHNGPRMAGAYCSSRVNITSAIHMSLAPTAMAFTSLPIEAATRVSSPFWTFRIFTAAAVTYPSGRQTGGRSFTPPKPAPTSNSIVLHSTATVNASHKRQRVRCTITPSPRRMAAG
jgi:hypothetical protein